MPFSNPIVAGATLVRTAMQSEGFATAADGTVSGWQISRDGSAVFTDVTIGGVNYTVNSTGIASFDTVNAATAITLGGNDLQTEIDALPDVTTAYGIIQSGTNTADIGTTETVCFMGTANDVYDARLYLMTFMGHLATNSAVTGIRADVRVRYTTDGTTPTTASPELRIHRVWLNDTEGRDFFFAKFYSPAADYLNWRFVITLQTNTGTCYINQTSTDRGLEVAVTDLGLRDSASSSALTQKSKSAGSPDPDPVTTYKRTYPAQWSRSWNNSGGDVYATNDTIKQGYYGGYGNGVSWVGFDFAQIQSDLAGATVVKVEAYLYFWHWYKNAGGTASLGFHTSTATSAPGYDGAKDNLNEKLSGSWGANEGRWVDITSAGAFTAAGWKTGAHTGITISGPDSSSEYYGKAYGNSQGHEPQLRITYRK